MLRALGEEFSQHLPAADLRRIMRRVGQRFGAAVTLPNCRRVDDLQDAMNDVWHRLEWGWVTLDESSEALNIVHHVSPLIALGDAAAEWSPALLEGVYECWFGSLGAGERLAVSQTGDLDETGVVRFRLGQPAPLSPALRPDPKPLAPSAAGWRGGGGGRWARGGSNG